MGKTGRPFTLYSRPRKRGKPIYYVRYKKPDGGWTTAESTGFRSEGAAESYALEQLKTGEVAAYCIKLVEQADAFLTKIENLSQLSAGLAHELRD